MGDIIRIANNICWENYFFCYLIRGANYKWKGLKNSWRHQTNIPQSEIIDGVLWKALRITHLELATKGKNWEHNN